MKRWAFLTVALYVVTLLLLYTPIVLLAYPDKADRAVFLFGVCLYLIPVMALFQAVLLLIPVAVAKGRPVKRRSIVISAVLGTIPMCLMVMGFVWSVVHMIWSEDSPMWGKLGAHMPVWVRLLLLGGLWLFWSILFYCYASSNYPRSFTSKVTTWFCGGASSKCSLPSQLISFHAIEMSAALR